MLVILSFLMILTFIVVLISGRLSAAVTLILVPTIFALIGGFGPEIGDMVVTGLKTVANTGALLLFAMTFFMIMTDAGMFDPVIRRIVSAVGGDPVRIFVGTVALGFIVALDGDGATVYMIVLSAFLAIYRRLGLSLPLVGILLLQCTGIGNMLPWGGPTARAATAMKVEMSEVFTPMILPLAAAVAFAFVTAVIFGMRERRRVGIVALDTSTFVTEGRPVDWRMGFNWLLTILLMSGLILEVLPLSYLFMIGTALALTVNFPNLKEQQSRINAHAPAILSVLLMLLSASVFIGILSGTGMADAVARAIVQAVPEALGPYMAIVTAILSIPMTWMVSNDVFYFGMLPILAEAASHYGVEPAAMARASLVGQPVHILSPLVASTYLLVSMLDLNYGQVQRRTIGWSVLTSLVIFAVALIIGVIPL